MRRLVVFAILLAVWLVFSGHFDALHLSLGLVCAALVAVTSADLLLPESRSSRTPLKVWRYVCYLPWLLYQVVLANLHVVYLVIFPHKIRPQVVRIKTGLTSDLALVTLANSVYVDARHNHDGRGRRRAVCARPQRQGRCGTAGG